MFHSQAPRLAIFVAAASLLAAPVFAQTASPAPDTATPSRNADVWNGRKHPPGAAVQEDERAAGADTTPAQQRQQTDEVEQLQQEILQRAQQGINDGVMQGTSNSQTTR